MQIELFESIKFLLDHIKDVEEDIKSMTKESYMIFSKVFEEHPDLPDEALETLQYQDIISQQLSATIDAIESVQDNLNYYLHSAKEDADMMHKNLKKLAGKLSKATDDARHKRAAFQGKRGTEGHEEIEFF
jgi:hypothetical protein